jgi:hypothetical protein
MRHPVFIVAILVLSNVGVTSTNPSARGAAPGRPSHPVRSRPTIRDRGFLMASRRSSAART